MLGMYGNKLGVGELLPECVNCSITARSESAFEDYIVRRNCHPVERLQDTVAAWNRIRSGTTDPVPIQRLEISLPSEWHRLCHHCTQKDVETSLMDMRRTLVHKCYRCDKALFVAWPCPECDGWIWYTTPANK